MANTIPSFNVADAVANPDLLENATFSRVMSPEERISKIKRDEWDALIRHTREILISLLAVVIVGIFINICLDIIRDVNASVDDKKWATSIITLIASGIVGYLTGKASK